MLESYFHERASFVTLTYSDENLPYTLEGAPCLCKRDVQLWLKRLRKHFSDRQIRYYLAGEYGTKTHRPHYHALLFGVGPSELDELYLQYGGKSGERRHSLLSDSWSFGLVHVGDVQRESIQYVAGYVTKKFTKKGDGNVPEFALMSRRPGIGAPAVAEIASVLQRYNLEKEARRELRVDGKTWPLGRFLQGKLAETLGVVFGTEEYVQRLAEQWVQANRRGADFLEYLVQSDAGRYAKLEARDKIFNQRNTL
jgi:hypothetical protein